MNHNVFKKLSHKLALILLILLFSTSAKAQDRAVWATAWSINSPKKIDALLLDLSKHHFNKLFIQARYRGDALYFPNRTDSTYKNPDSLCYLLADTLFDPLAYTIEKAKQYNIKTYAWVTTFVISPHDLSKLGKNHVFFKHPEWLLETKSGRKIGYNSYEGAFLDPANNEVREYTINVLSDIVQNYEIDGIQLDYIRYPDTLYGWNEESRRLFHEDSLFDFARWKQQKINSFLNRTYIQLKSINPNVEISAAVIANRDKAINKYAQNWEFWLQNHFIDRAYVMAYNTLNASFKTLITQLNQMKQHDKMTIVIRAWQEYRRYHVSKINDKLAILKRYQFMDIGYYNYSGLKKYGYLESIHY